ncbi:hypothetical protein HFU84_02190 [Acidithiobacillus sp. CV18-2]|uniref:Minor curlin subunit n=1 Tax=Igneacidithiobacillus copahuensis TaxID=2724909 RepID=A0AAE2YPN5_9PROT|nr:hypothetical protein [Igneacidithiobacillus copahuensis]MBU2753623.1 hypothetical protein [Acidithiobacillus sp. CV18-3]MBU2758525.1 hypothetical protein [Acidithiobacillus sp. BN09-2]MBU2776341.1 hypothetical protein [Acidithiobacillus sp. CV18-2]MBU2795257.1 hypothetical protein [Acidithiobacillus sp. VAN18-2]MBU2799517.1 hypothetical protein [Acidithiobacillus sp. VAN18-4]UTV81316.1 hypothetical protein MQE22_01500 [Acidithiobacillus sp. YTS05]
MSRNHLLCSGFFGISALLTLGTAVALPLPNTAQSIISDNALGNVHGVMQSNMAAGSNNLQANIANIIMSPSGQGAATSAGVEQQAGSANPSSFTQQQTKILGRAFQGANGLMSINQAAGTSNAEANRIQVVMGAAQPVSNQILAQSLSGISSNSKNKSTEGGPSSQVVVAATAFHNAGGIAQVNQTSGSGNAAANSFALGVAPGVMQ